MADRRRVCRILVGKPEEKRPLGRPRLGWEDNIKMGLQEWDVGAWTGSIWLMIGTGGGHCECVNEPSGSMICGEFLD
jgi:hypothetical protein